MPDDVILIRPIRGHQSRHLNRWVKHDEDAYECPSDEADRLIRHGVARVVDGPAATTPMSPPEAKAAFDVDDDEDDEEEEVTS